MILANSKYAAIPSCCDSFELSCFVNDVSSVNAEYVATVKYLTPENTFLEDLRFSKLEIFL